MKQINDPLLGIRRLMLALMVQTMWSLHACKEPEQHQTRTTSSRMPVDESEEIPGYLDSVEKEVVKDSSVEITIGDSTIKVPAGSANFDYRIRMSRRSSPPELTESESQSLGDAKSDVIAIEVFEPSTNKILSSDDLLTAYELKQTFVSKDSTNLLGMMIVSDAGTVEEKRLLLPRSELTVSESSALRSSEGTLVTVSVFLRLTNATVWLAHYTDAALTAMTIGKAESASSVGGGQTKAIDRQPAALSGAININGGAEYTSDPTVTLSLSAPDATEGYITNTAGCDGGGTWSAISASQSWTLPQTNTVSRVYARFRNGEGQESACVNDSIIHDDLNPTAPSDLLDGASHNNLNQSPLASWTAGSDTGSGLSHYEMAIGTSVGGTDIKGWTAVGSDTSAVITGLSLVSSTTYYTSVRSVDMAGLRSAATPGDGWTTASGGGTLTHHTLFVTSASYNGNLGGLSGGDAKCATRAAAGSATQSLPGAWRAILSNATVNAKDRLNLNSGLDVRDSQGNGITSVSNRLWMTETLSLAGEIRFDENGSNAAPFNAWTGTQPDGTSSGLSATCQDWTMGSNSVSGIKGASSFTISKWLSDLVMPCELSLRLYCINVQE